MIFKFTLSNDIDGAFLLPHDPIGWDDVETAIERGLEYHGLFYNQTAKLKYYCGAGKEYIQNVYDRDGIDGIVNITIEISCPCQEPNDSPDYSIDYSDEYGSETGGDCNWEVFYEGELEFISIEFEDEYISCGIINKNFFSKVRNRLDTKVQLNSVLSLEGTAIDAANVNKMTLHSKAIKYNNEGTSTEQFIQCGTTQVDVGNTLYNTCNLRLQGFVPYENNISEDGSGNTVLISPLICQSDTKEWEAEGCLDANIVYNPAYPNSFIYRNTLETRDINIHVKVSGKRRTVTDIVYPVVFKFQILIFDPSIIMVPVTIDIDTNAFNLPVGGGVFPFNSIDTAFNVDYTGTINVPLNHNVYLISYDTYSAGGCVINMVQNVIYDCAEASLSYNTTYDPTECDTVMIHEAFTQVCKYISDSNDNVFKSELLGRTNSNVIYPSNGEGSFIGITNGYKIRGFGNIETNPDQSCESITHVTEQSFNKEISCTLKQLFDFTNTVFNVGLGVEKVGDDYNLRIERKEYFYNKAINLITLDWVPKIRTTLANEFIFSNFNLGYNKFEAEELNGTDEFNTSRQYNTKIRNTEKALDIKTDIITSGYCIEFTRRNNVRFTATTDYKFDEDLFAIATKRDTAMLTIAEKDENFTDINNLIDPPTSYNLRFSPSRCVTRWISYIGSLLYRVPGNELIFTNGEYNVELNAKETSNTIGDYSNAQFYEKQNISWDGSAYIEPIWLPEYVEFEYPLTYSEWLYLRDNPTGVVSYSGTDSNHLKGFIVSVKYKPTKGIATFKLLKAYDS